MSDDLKCSDCGGALDCRGGCSAHRRNWYCPKCENTRAPQQVDVDLLTARLTANADHLRQCFDIPRLKPAIDDMCIESLLENISQAIAALQQARDAIPVWRSVEDGLPGKYQPVFYIYLGVHNQPRFCLYDPDHGSGFGREPATHWLSAIPPLPVPPADEVDNSAD